MIEKLRPEGIIGGQLVKNISSLPIYFGAYASINATGIFRP